MMTKLSRLTIIFLLSLFVFSSCQQTKKQVDHQAPDYVSLIQNDSLNKLDVYIDGQYFTSYMYADSFLRKPVLYPLMAANELRVTRGFPISPNPGERIDHPHHYGLWFNHGDVNDVDYWNSAVIPEGKGLIMGGSTMCNSLKWHQVILAH